MLSLQSRRKCGKSSSEDYPKPPPLVRRRAAICWDAPRPDAVRTARSAGAVKSAARCLARREQSHAQARPFFTGGASMASTHLLTGLSTVAPDLGSSVRLCARRTSSHRPLMPCGAGRVVYSSDSSSPQIRLFVMNMPLR